MLNNFNPLKGFKKTDFFKILKISFHQDRLLLRDFQIPEYTPFLLTKNYFIFFTILLSNKKFYPSQKKFCHWCQKRKFN